MAVTPAMFTDRESYDLYRDYSNHVISQSRIVPEKSAFWLDRQIYYAGWVLARDSVPWIWWRILGYPRKACCISITKEEAKTLLQNSSWRFHENSRSDLDPVFSNLSMAMGAISMFGAVATAIMPIAEYEGGDHDSDRRSATSRDSEERMQQQFDRAQALRDKGWEHEKSAGDHLGKAVDGGFARQPYAASRELAEAWKEKIEAEKDYWDANQMQQKAAQERVEESWAEHGGTPGGCTIS